MQHRSNFSWTDAVEFQRFCKSAHIRCEEAPVSRYFREGLCDGAFLTTEYTYDAGILRDYFLAELAVLPNVEMRFSSQLSSIEEDGGEWVVQVDSEELKTSFILNATYAGVNNIHALVGYQPFKIKYELCEIILCEPSGLLTDVGITVMDGPFFSIMPFGKTGLHSLTSVTFTPHATSYEVQPTFSCQERSGGTCFPASLGNCNDCVAKPCSAWPYMSQLASKYLRDEFEFSYHKSLFSMKPILMASEVDDSRPTIIRVVSEKPTMISVLSGKMNTVYDLDSYLDEECAVEGGSR